VLAVAGNKESEDNMVPERLAVSIAEAGLLIGVSRTTIYKLIDAGLLATVTIGRRRLVLIASINELMKGKE
jgi:excisionase family DNA binding protein